MSAITDRRRTPGWLIPARSNITFPINRNDASSNSSTDPILTHLAVSMVNTVSFITASDTFHTYTSTAKHGSATSHSNTSHGLYHPLVSGYVFTMLCPHDGMT